MKQKKLGQAAIFEALVRKETTQKRAAESLNLSERQIRTKLKRFKHEGIKSLIHKSKGKPSKRLWKSEERDRAMNIIKNEWLDFGPAFIAKKLKDCYGIKVSSETIRKNMVQEGLWIPLKKR